MSRATFVAVGDMTTDAFICLFPDQAEVVDGEDPKLCMGYADKIPFEKAYIVPAVGNSANAAVSASRLGLPSALVAHVGDDAQGREMIERLKKEGVDARFVTVNNDKPSNYHYVLWYKDDRTILIKQEDFVYHVPKLLEEPRWMYFSSVGEHALEFHHELAEYVRKHTSVNFVFQPGTFQLKISPQEIQDLYRAAKLFFCNREEAQVVLNTHEYEIEPLAKGIRALGPEIVVITDGPKGAYTYEGNKLWFMPPYPDPKPPLERTGAGDAFSSTYTAALALGLSIDDAMRWGPINSMSVVQYVGAQEGLLTRPQLEEFLANAPVDYKPKLLKEL